MDIFKKWFADVACVSMIPDEETLYFVLEEDLDNIPVYDIQNEFENWIAVPFDDVMKHIDEFYVAVSYLHLLTAKEGKKWPKTLRSGMK